MTEGAPIVEVTASQRSVPHTTVLRRERRSLWFRTGRRLDGGFCGSRSSHGRRDRGNFGLAAAELSGHSKGELAELVVGEVSETSDDTDDHSLVWHLPALVVEGLGVVQASRGT